MSGAILTVENLRVTFPPSTVAVAEVSLTLHERQTLALVGESGSGKSVTAMSVLRLIPSPPGVYESGRIVYRTAAAGEIDLLRADDGTLRRVRGGEIAMIFQEPMTSLNPVFTIGEQIIETVRLHQRASRRGARDAALSALRDVGIREPERRIHDYPHEFSGGMRQRVMIAIALACRSRVLLADEPTTALDVTVQAQILGLLRDLRRSRGLGVLLISHDLGVVAENADIVGVMYAGRIVEYADVETLYSRPAHPYTRGLLACVPRLGARRERLTQVRDVIDATPSEIHGTRWRAWWPGHQPPADLLPGGASGDCVLREVEPGHWVGVWRTSDAGGDPSPIPDLDWRRESEPARISPEPERD